MPTVTARIKKFNEGLLPEMLALKYQAMRENIYRFFRGTCHLFYEDLSKVNSIPPSPLTWICGDLHMENFGSYKGNNGLVYFDLNDFDEAVLAPAAWDLARMITSIFVAFKSMKIEEKKAMRIAELFLKTYSSTLAAGKAKYIEPKIAKGIVCTFLKAVTKRKYKKLLRKKTVGDKRKPLLLLDDQKHFEIDKELKRQLFHHITEWIIYNNDGPYNYEVIDGAFRIAGTGSIGLKRYIFLLKSRNIKGKYLLVDMKEETASSLAPYVKIPQPDWTSEAERATAIQQRMQNVCPLLLSTTFFKDTSYLIQQLQPVKDSINLEVIKDRYRDILQVIDDMAMLTASAQLRSSGRQGAAVADELIAFGENKQWQRLIIKYALQYSKKAEQDFIFFKKNYKKGFAVKSAKNKNS